MKVYLAELDNVKSGHSSHAIRANWMVFEMLDQVQRNASGGETIKWWDKVPIPESDFIYQSLWDEFQNYLKSRAQTNPVVTPLIRLKTLI